MLRIGFVLMGMAVSLAACDKKTPTADTTSSTGARARRPWPSRRQRALPGVDDRRHRCPTDVQGATTSVADVDGGVALTIIAADDKAVAEIRERTTRAVEMAQRFGGGPQRVESAHHGRCAAMLRGAKSDAKNIDGGTQITILGTDAVDVTRVRADVRDRLAHP
jgi:hypothetical protein